MNRRTFVGTLCAVLTAPLWGKKAAQPVKEAWKPYSLGCKIPGRIPASTVTQAMAQDRWERERAVMERVLAELARQNYETIRRYIG